MCTACVYGYHLCKNKTDACALFSCTCIEQLWKDSQENSIGHSLGGLGTGQSEELPLSAHLNLLNL
jgi:hypothetical protein